MAARKSQKALLQRLEEYGDSLLHDSITQQNGSNRRRTNLDQDDADEDGSPKLSVTPMKNKKKKLKKRQRKLLKNQQNGDIVKTSKSSTSKALMSKKMSWLKKALGSDGAIDVSRTRAVVADDGGGDEEITLKSKPAPEVIVFEDPAKRKQKAQAAVAVQEEEQGTGTEFDMSSARFEVRKLGIEGFGGEKKTEARVSLLLNLGAKPAKNKSYMNYKEFQKKRKAELDAEREKREEAISVGEKVTKDHTPKRLSGKKKKNTRQSGEKIGHYKDGVLFIKKDDIKKIKQSK